MVTQAPSSEPLRSSGGQAAPELAAPLALVALTGLVAYVTLAVSLGSDTLGAWWPAGGLGVVAVLVTPQHLRAPVLAVLTAAFVAANALSGRALLPSVLLGAVDGLETLVVVALLHRLTRERLHSLHEVRGLILAAACGAVVAGVGIGGIYGSMLGASFTTTAVSVAVAHGASVLVLAPLALVDWSADGPDRGRQALEPLGVAIVMALCLVGGFGPLVDGLPGLALTAMPLPLLVWAAARHGVGVVSLELVWLALVLTASAVLFFESVSAAATSGGGAGTVQLIQVYLICAVLIGLPLALAMREREQVMERTVVDLTERLALQQRLESERTWSRAVMDTASSMIVVTDESGVVIGVNPATTRVSGFAAEELVGRPFWETLIPADSRASVTDAMSNVLPLPPQGEIRMRTKHGAERTVLFSHATHRSSTDEPATLVFSATDITEARESAGMVEHLLRSVTAIAFVGTDLAGRITLFSVGAERLLGMRADDVAGRPLTELLAAVPADGEELDAGAAPVFDDLLGTGGPESTPRTGDWLMLPEGRARVRVSMGCHPVRDDHGRVYAYLFVGRVGTETRRNQEILVNALRREREVVTRLQDLDRAKDDFISTVSHELRTPMSSIIGSAEMLAEGMLGELETRQQQMVDVITRNGDRLLALADDLLTLATFDRTTTTAPGTSVDLRAVVAESIEVVRPRRDGRDLHWRVTLPEHPVHVVGDATHLERAITNLLTNAVKFTADGGRVETVLRLDPVHRSAIVTVRDSGIGIAQDDLEHVFDRFFRTEQAEQEAIQGSGLGLAIVKSIIERHEGRISVESVHGEGTAVTLRLPLQGDGPGRTGT